jgi:hypothetical protein
LFLIFCPVFKIKLNIKVDNRHRNNSINMKITTLTNHHQITVIVVSLIDFSYIREKNAIYIYICTWFMVSLIMRMVTAKCVKCLRFCGTLSEYYNWDDDYSSVNRIADETKFPQKHQNKTLIVYVEIDLNARLYVY